MQQDSSSHDPRHDEEASNMALVQNFFADWSKRDAQLLATYLADDFAYQMIEGEPDLIGPAIFVETLKDVLISFTEIDMQIRRITCHGHVVMVDRFDRMMGKDKDHSMSFEVVGILLVTNRKLRMLRDYPIPGGVFELGNAWLEGSPADKQRLSTAAKREY